jgi:nucleoside-diphosphate-sugar epimerase
VKICVTGATGFVGSHLVEALLARGHEVACLVRTPAKSARLFPDAPLRLAVGDLADPEALRDGCRDAEVVFHSAALTAARSRDEFFEVNARGTARVLDAAADVAPGLQHFVYVSSAAAAGPTSRGRLLVEDDPPRPVTPYGESKLAGERAVRERDLPWTIVRPPTVYGPRDPEMARAFKLARWGVLPVFGDGRQELTAIHVRDLVAALQAVLTDETRGRTSFATHPEVFTTAHLVRRIYHAVRAARGDAATTRTPPVLRVPAPLTRAALAVTGTAAKLLGRRTLLASEKANEFLADAWACSGAALTDATGWTAQTALDDGLHDTAHWYRAHGWI